MAPKRKAPVAPLAEEAAKKKNGGAGRGQGRKKSALNAPGNDDPALPAKRQASLADLLGERFAKRPKPELTGEPLWTRGHCVVVVWF